MEYVIQDTRDRELCQKGLYRKLVRLDDRKPEQVVGYFSDLAMAKMVRDELNLATQRVGRGW